MNPFPDYQAIASDPDRWLQQARALKFAADELWKATKGALEIVGLLLWTAQEGDNEQSRQAAIQSLEETPDEVNQWLLLSPVCFMLAGLSLENLVKGILIGQDATLVGGNKVAWSGSRGHNLEELLHRAGIPLMTGDKELLELLAHNVMWGGRYPVPISAHHGPIPSHMPIELYQSFEGLFSRLVGQYDHPA